MVCTHDVEHLVGTADGITCKNCGKVFATFAELEVDRPKKQEKKVEAPAETIEAVATEAPAEKPKKSTKKGAK